MGFQNVAIVPPKSRQLAICYSHLLQFSSHYITRVQTALEFIGWYNTYTTPPPPLPAALISSVYIRCVVSDNCFLLCLLPKVCLFSSGLDETRQRKRKIEIERSLIIDRNSINDESLVASFNNTEERFIRDKERTDPIRSGRTFRTVRKRWREVSDRQAVPRPRPRPSSLNLDAFIFPCGR